MDDGRLTFLKSLVRAGFVSDIVVGQEWFENTQIR